jgi:hypothetical protein
LLSDFGNYKYYILGLYGNLILVLDLRTAITIKTETSEFTTAKEIETKEQIATVNKVLTTAYEDHSDTEYLLSKLVEVNKPDEPDTTSKTIDNNKI